jgi:hypothetical protein
MVFGGKDTVRLPRLFETEDLTMFAYVCAGVPRPFSINGACCPLAFRDPTPRTADALMLYVAHRGVLHDGSPLSLLLPFPFGL